MFLLDISSVHISFLHIIQISEATPLRWVTFDERNTTDWVTCRDWNILLNPQGTGFHGQPFLLLVNHSHACPGMLASWKAPGALEKRQSLLHLPGTNSREIYGRFCKSLQKHADLFQGYCGLLYSAWISHIENNNTQLIIMSLLKNFSLLSLHG